MSKVTVNAIKIPPKDIEVDGMKITVGEPPFEIEADFELIFDDRAENQAWVRKQYPYLWVRKIDGEEVWPIAKFSEFRALRQRLGRDGYSKLMTAISEIFEGQEQKVKNSQGTPSSDDDVS